jgi:hypothetical protein
MCRTLRNLSMVAILLSGFAALALADRAGGEASVEPAALEVAMSPPRAPQARAAQPRFVYASGARGAGYYPSPGPRSAARAQTTSSRRTVGPGVRDWTTGQRTNMHRPWLRSR